MNKEMMSYFSLSDLPFTKEIKSHNMVRLPSVERALN